MSWIFKVQEAIDYIESKILEDITIESVGRVIHYSPTSIHNIFSAVTGYSISEYIRFRRLSNAINDLAEGKLSIGDIAYKYKYNSPESFSKAFRRLFGYAPSKFIAIPDDYMRFDQIKVDYKLMGGFRMKRNIIPNLMRVDWSNDQQQNEFVNCVVSALNSQGEKLDYKYVCAVSGSAFRTSFSMPSEIKWNHGNYHVINTPNILKHTFKMLGYEIKQHIASDYDFDKRLIMNSIDRGIPVITLEGVIDCSDACLISGYDNDGDVLLGYSPFMDIKEDHDECPDMSGYFRKSRWQHSFYNKDNNGRIIIIEGKTERPSEDEILKHTLVLVKQLIQKENLTVGQYNGLAAHRAFANALMTYEWDDIFEPYLNVMCNYKQYLDRQYAVKFLYDNGREDIMKYYEEISQLSNHLSDMIPQDFTAEELFRDKINLKPYSITLLKICELEEEILKIL